MRSLFCLQHERDNYLYFNIFFAMSYTSINSEFRKDDLTIKNIKKNISNICNKERSKNLLKVFDTLNECDTNLRKDLFNSFFTFNISVRNIRIEESIIKVETWWRVHGKSWVVKTLSMDINNDFTFSTKLFSIKDRWYIDVSEEDLLEHIKEILQTRAQECLLFENEFTF